MKPTSSSPRKIHVSHGSSETAGAKGHTRTPTKHGLTTVLRDGAVVIDVQWCRSTDTLSPTTEQIKGYFQRHREAPVHISFRQQRADKTSSNLWQNELNEYFDVILEALPRWRSIRLWAPYVPRQSFVGKIFPATSPIEEVVIEGPSFFDIPVICQLLSPCWNGSRSLKTFQLISRVDDSVGSMMINPGIYLPLDNLTHIQLCNKLCILECSEVLCHAPYVVECLFNNVTGSSCVLRPMRCKHLRKLTLVANTEDFKLWKTINLGTLFDSLKAPDLKHLELASIPHWEEENLSLTDFLQRSRCNLQILALDSIGMSEDQLRSILVMSSSLRILEVHGSPSHIPQPVTPSPMPDIPQTVHDCPILCPQLEILSINETIIRTFSDDIVANVLSGSNLKMLRVKADGARPQQNPKAAKLIKNVKNRRNITVLDEDILLERAKRMGRIYSSERWGGSKMKNPDLSCESLRFTRQGKQ